MKRALGVIVFAYMLLTVPVPAFAGAAQDNLKASVDEVIGILRQTKVGEPGRIDKLSVAVQKIFDPEELAKRTLGTHWQQFSPDEQRQFTKAFVKLLQNTYLRRLETYTDEKVVFLGETVLADNRTEVSTKIITSNKEVPIVYRLIQKPDWKVYDVIIEGVSLVQNYRQQFTQILTKDSPTKLIERVSAMSAG